jgi:putative glutamine amidotransferase
MKPFLAIALLLSPTACVSPASDQTEKKNKAPHILISKDNKGQISEWLHILDPQLQIRELYGTPLDSLEFYLDRAQAVVIGGGKDIDPKWYGQPQYRSLCGPIDPYRDSLEYAMICYAREKVLPTLGICRGQQMINVAYGGTLIPDIPSFIGTLQAHKSSSDSAHSLLPVTGSWIRDSFSFEVFWVNSRHHQCVDALAAGFRVDAYAPDSVIEAISLADSIHPFVQAVQFHPEDLRDSLSNSWGALFLQAVSSQHNEPHTHE